MQHVKCPNIIEFIEFCNKFNLQNHEGIDLLFLRYQLISIALECRKEDITALFGKHLTPEMVANFNEAQVRAEHNKLTSLLAGVFPQLCAELENQRDA